MSSVGVRVSTAKRFLISNHQADPEMLAQAWADSIIALETGSASKMSPISTNDASIQAAAASSSTARSRIIQATARSLPLLEDASSVPFVCRYRTDIVSPLSTQQVHFLWDLLSKHAALESLRVKLLQVVPPDDKSLRRCIQTSTSKLELEDLYAPYKPPHKGSILERIQTEHPELVQQVVTLWTGFSAATAPHPNSLQPRTALLHLIATKIAAEPSIGNVVRQELTKHCRIKTTLIIPTRNKEDSKNNENWMKYRNYADDFSSHLTHLRDHQVLAISRGVQQKCLQMTYDVDSSKVEGCIRYALRSIVPPVLQETTAWRSLVFEEAVHLAWTQWLRRRGTSRLWNDKCRAAQERAMQVFEQNVHDALLAPPRYLSSYILAMDPGFQAGIKCALLDPQGSVLQLETIQFLFNSNREHGLEQLGKLLTIAKSKTSADDNDAVVVVALGNGHGSQKARSLVQDASTLEGIPVEIQLVNEAGASVWSVTPRAKDEFPNEPPAAIAAISIGRRLQNPLQELVKVPPRSLGLGMYQHDLSEKELDEKLHLTSVDAVATVGVEVNRCSLEILQKVPGLSKLAAKVIKTRPLRQRQDLLKVSGLGPKTFENCAAFCRVDDSAEALDRTLVHPESYELARWMLKKLHWKLSEKPKDIPPRSEWGTKWDTVVKAASEKFDVSRERVLAVVENLVDSMTQIDPRLRANETSQKAVTKAGSLSGCVLLSAELAELSALQKSCPVRGIIGTVRTITDFGAFIDFGASGDGLLHTSKLGPVQLQSLLIGEQVGVDVLSVTDNKVSLGLTGLGLEADASRSQQRASNDSQRRNVSTSSQPKKSKPAKTSKSTTKRSRSEGGTSQPPDKRSRGA